MKGNRREQMKFAAVEQAQGAACLRGRAKP